MQELGEKVTKEERANIESAIADLKATFDKQDVDAIKKPPRL